MTSLQSTGSAEISVMTGMEKKLVSALTSTAGAVSRLETLDEEQRAEIYAILGAIQNDTATHRAMADALASHGPAATNA